MDEVDIFGREVSIDDTAAWEALTPLAGQVIEVDMNSTSLTVLHDSWAGFFIDKVEIHLEGSVTLHTRLIDAEDQTISDALGEFSDSGRFAIHLCRSRPCAEVGHEQDGKLHVTKVKIFSFADYIDSADYVGAGPKKLARGWNRYLVKKREDDALRARGEAEKGGAPAKEPARAPKRRATLPAKSTTPTELGEGGGGPPPVSEEMRFKLKEKLKSVKARIIPAAEKSGGIEATSPIEEDSKSLSEQEVIDSVPESPKLTGGTSLVPRPPAW